MLTRTRSLCGIVLFSSLAAAAGCSAPQEGDEPVVEARSAALVSGTWIDHWYDSTNGGPPAPPTGTFISAPATASRAKSRLNVTVQKSGGKMYRSDYNPSTGAWGAWNTIGTKVFPVSSRPSIVVWNGYDADWVLTAVAEHQPTGSGGRVYTNMERISTVTDSGWKLVPSSSNGVCTGPVSIGLAYPPANGSALVMACEGGGYLWTSYYPSTSGAPAGYDVNNWGPWVKFEDPELLQPASAVSLYLQGDLWQSPYQAAGDKRYYMIDNGGGPHTGPVNDLSKVFPTVAPTFGPTGVALNGARRDFFGVANDGKAVFWTGDTKTTWSTLPSIPNVTYINYQQVAATVFKSGSATYIEVFATFKDGTVKETYYRY